MTTISELINDLSRLKEIDRNKSLTIEGQPIQSVVIREYKSEKTYPVKDNDGNQVFKKNEDGELVLDENGNSIPDIEVVTTLSYKAHFSTGKQNDDYQTANRLVEALKTLSTLEKAGTVAFGDNDIFIVGRDYTFADRVNIDTDATINDINKL